MGRLRITGLVGRAALNNSGRAVPDPREAKPRLADRQHGVLQRREVPGLATVGGDRDARYLAAPAPSETGDLVEARSWQSHVDRGSRERDHRLRLHREGEYARLSGRGDEIRIF